MPAEYVGRFAPSPTGPLHFGSLLAATVSYLEAKVNRGQWLLRIENIDPPREMPGAQELIVRALDAYGFEWHGPITYQQDATSRHEDLVADLLRRQLAYPCTCSRRDLADAAQGQLGPVYPGTCRTGCQSGEHAIRIKTTSDAITFSDRLQGKQTQHLESDSGDFIIKRRDGLIAYHLAVVADDFDAGVTDVVRGVDLLDSTTRHIWLQRCLGFPVPGYAHFPVAENDLGQKLSKLTGAPAISMIRVGQTLCAVLEALKQEPPATLAAAGAADIWDWAVANWDLSVLRNQRRISADQYVASG